MEFGHTALSSLPECHPDWKVETQIIEYIAEKVYQGKSPPEYEDIVSGRGIRYVYEALVKDVKDVPQNLQTGQIAEEALKGENVYAVQAMRIHYKFLIRILKNLSIGLQCKGALLAGDNQITNNPFLEKDITILREEFLDTPKSDWIEDNSLFTQTQKFRLNEAGALHFARK